MASFNDFYNYANGKVFDTNGNIVNVNYVQWSGSLAGQCVSLIKGYLKWGGCGVKAYGNAIHYWTCRNTNGILNHCDVVTGSPRNGDIGVSSGGDPTYGHIFIYYNGQAFAQNVSNDPHARLTPLSWQGTIYGYLRPKFISAYSSADLINEHAVATITEDINKRKNSPDGSVVETLKAGTKIEYTQKWVGYGHRYISWVESGTRYFVAVSGSETQGVEPWATFEEIKEPEIKLIQEDGVATMTVDSVRARLNSPTGDVVRIYNSGDKIKYTHKYIGNGHRYIVWAEGSNKIFLAVAGTEDRSDPWATFGSVDESTTTPPKTEDTKPVEQPKPDYTKNVKGYGVDISEHQGVNFDVTPYDFVIIRASWGTNTDKMFEHNVKKCEDEGVPYGVYCYDYALSDEDAKDEADYILNLIKDKNVQLGVWIDMEDADKYKAKKGVLNKERCTSSCKIFCDALKAEGYYTGVYMSSSWINNYVVTDYPIWVANWGINDGNINSDQSSVGVMHQYVGSPLDKDVIYHDIDFYKSNPVKHESVVKPEPEAPTEEPKEDTVEEPKHEDGIDKNKVNSLIDLLISLIQKLLSIFK